MRNRLSTWKQNRERLFPRVPKSKKSFQEIPSFLNKYERIKYFIALKSKNIYILLAISKPSDKKRNQREIDTHRINQGLTFQHEEKFRTYRCKFLFFFFSRDTSYIYITIFRDRVPRAASFVDDPTSARSNHWHLLSRRLSSPYVSSLSSLSLAPSPASFGLSVYFLCRLPDCHANFSLHYHWSRHYISELYFFFFF